MKPDYELGADRREGDDGRVAAVSVVGIGEVAAAIGVKTEPEALDGEPGAPEFEARGGAEVLVDPVAAMELLLVPASAQARVARELFALEAVSNAHEG